MMKKIAGSFLVLAILGWVAGIATRHGYLYILSFVLLAAAILLILLLLAVDLIWKFLPGDFKKSHGVKKGRFTAIFFFSVLLFYIVKGIIDELCLPDVSGFIGLLVSMAISLFAAFWGWSLIRQIKGRIIIAGSGVFILFIAILSFPNFITLKSGEITHVSSTEKLRSLPYIDWAPQEEIEKARVAQYNPELAFDGLSLYTSRTSQKAYLIDMRGNIVHEWAKGEEDYNAWGEHIELCDNGDLLVVSGEAYMLIWLDWDSNVRGKKKILVHHDACLDESKNIHALVKKRDVVFWRWIPLPIINDYIVVLSPDLEIKRKISIYDLVRERFSLDRIVGVYQAILGIFKPKNILKLFILKTYWYKENVAREADFLHTNSLEIIDRDIEGFCSTGDWLISIRHLDLVGVVDAKTEELGWNWGPGETSMQHHPTLLKNGNVLIFDNGCVMKSSRIVELNPVMKKIVWEYEAAPTEEFYSQTRGGNQRLPNGNTLITESDKGHVFEVTKEGKVVWDFYNPNVDMESNRRETMYRMMRITNSEIYKLLKR